MGVYIRVPLFKETTMSFSASSISMCERPPPPLSFSSSNKSQPYRFPEMLAVRSLTPCQACVSGPSCRVRSKSCIPIDKFDLILVAFMTILVACMTILVAFMTILAAFMTRVRGRSADFPHCSVTSCTAESPHAALPSPVPDYVESLSDYHADDKNDVAVTCITVL